MIKKSGYLFRAEYITHNPGTGHPESPERLIAIQNLMDKCNLINNLKNISPLTDSAAIKKSILKIHSQQHYDAVINSGKTGEIAKFAVAGVLGAVTEVMEEKVKNVFCAVRPPGHHAHNNGPNHDGHGQGEGFCFFNNIAIAAQFAQDNYNCKQVLVLDWDYHHGNGTEWAFYNNPTIFFFSTHSLFNYPATGFDYRNGEGPGENYNLNIPLKTNARDEDIISAWENQLLPALKDLNFSPDLVLISAGFDSRENDPLGDFRVTDSGFSKLTKIAMDIAEKNCDGRIISVLEGGYNPEGLAQAVLSHLSTLMS